MSANVPYNWEITMSFCQLILIDREQRVPVRWFGGLDDILLHSLSISVKEITDFAQNANRKQSIKYKENSIRIVLFIVVVLVLRFFLCG